MSLGKIIIIILLVCVLAGLAWVKALYSSQENHSEDLRKAGWMSPQEVSDEYIKIGDARRLFDSIYKRVGDSLQDLYSDSMAVLQSYTADPALANTDSLKNLIKTLEEARENDKRLIENIIFEKNMQLENLVYAFYSNELKALPVDLSEYERNVSVREITDKATRYFDISESYLKKIVREKR